MCVAEDELATLRDFLADNVDSLPSVTEGSTVSGTIIAILTAPPKLKRDEAIYRNVCRQSGHRLSSENRHDPHQYGAVVRVTICGNCGDVREV